MFSCRESQGIAVWAFLAVLVVPVLRADPVALNGLHNTTLPHGQLSDFFGSAAPELYPRPLSYDFPLDCLSTFLQLHQPHSQNCSLHRSGNAPVLLHHCASNDANGVVVLQRTSTAHNNEGTAMYRVRIVGPDGVALAPIVYCSPSIAVAAYALLNEGRHSLEVLQLYASFSYPSPNSSAFQYQPWAGYLTLTVAKGGRGSSSSGDAGSMRTAAAEWADNPQPLPALTAGGQQRRQPELLRRLAAVDPSVAIGANVSIEPLSDPGGTPGHAPTNSISIAGGLPLCERGRLLPGQWKFRSWPSQEALAAAQQLQRTCIWGDPTHDCQASHKSLQTNHTALHWQPHGCHLLPLGDDPVAPGADGGGSGGVEGGGVAVASTCLDTKRVCFVGDSHARYAHNTLVVWASGYSLSVDHAAKQLLLSKSSEYIKMLWGHDWEPHQAANCTHVVVNFGQWPASYRAGPRPWSAAAYLHHVRMVRSKLSELRAAGKQVFWLATCSPSLKAKYEVASIDWRTDPLLLLYNRLAHDEMAAAGIAVIDTWGPSTTLLELTGDGIHFSERGVVGRAVLNMVVHNLCSPPASAGAGAGAGRARQALA